MNNGNAVSIIFLYCSAKVKSNRSRKDTYREMDIIRMSNRRKKMNRLPIDGANKLFLTVIIYEN